MKSTLERRFMPLPVELRASGDQPVIGGYAAKFGVYSANLGGFVEEIAPGAFNRSLANSPDVVCLFNHDSNELLGRTGVNLEVSVDDVGLLYECTPVMRDTQAASTVEKVRSGLVRSSSFAFYCLDDEWDLTDQGFPLRRVLEALLVDVSPVTRPAYPDATAGLRSLAEARNLDYAAVLAASEHNNLRDLLGQQPEEEERDADGSGAPTHPATRLAGMRLL